MKKVGLRVVEQINALTVKRLKLLEELQRRKSGPPPKPVGAWRHEYNLEALNLKIELLERRRILLLKRHTNL